MNDLWWSASIAEKLVLVPVNGHENVAVIKDADANLNRVHAIAVCESKKWKVDQIYISDQREEIISGLAALNIKLSKAEENTDY